MVVEIRRRRLQDAKSFIVKRRHGAKSACAMSACEVLQEELAAAACFFCCLLLLLLQVLLLHKEGTHAAHDASELIGRQGHRQHSLKQPKTLTLAILGGKLGQSKASGEFSANRIQGSNLLRVSLKYGSTYHSMLPNYGQLTHIHIFKPIRDADMILGTHGYGGEAGKYLFFGFGETKLP